jgi:NADPH-dependent curcumin reductase CurA
VINYKTSDLKEAVSKITAGKFVDVVYENVGGDIFNQVLIGIMAVR